MVDLKGGPERGDGVDKTGKRQSRNIRHLVKSKAPLSLRLFCMMKYMHQYKRNKKENKYISRLL